MKKDFLKYQAQTSGEPLGLKVASASGNYICDIHGKKYLDFVAGVSANTLGHSNPKINQAIITQLENYSHVMVYGEFIQQVPLELCKLLAKLLPEPLETVYLTNSGAEATEGAIKLAKRVTGRHQMIAAKQGYHGNTQGAMSVCGVEGQNSAYRPLVPGTRFIEFNNLEDLPKITTETAAVILETIQGGAGFIEPRSEFLKKIKERCLAVGALLILDEIQTGIGRTGKLFGFENYDVVPDILIIGKGLGGGMPIGAFIASQNRMFSLSRDPGLGHITTFGGHPVIAAAGLATLNEVIKSTLIEQTITKEKIIRKLLHHKSIREIRGKGLMLAVILNSNIAAIDVIKRCLDKGLIVFSLLFDQNAIRITPPLTISKKAIETGCSILMEVLNEIENN